MHRADREIVERIELAYIETGRKPIRGQWNGGQWACGLGVIGAMGYKSAAEVSGRSEHWVRGFVFGFDRFDSDAACGLSMILLTAAGMRDYAEMMRGFKAGVSCGRRVFAQPLVEVVPQRELEAVPS